MVAMSERCTRALNLQDNDGETEMLCPSVLFFLIFAVNFIILSCQSK